MKRVLALAAIAAAVLFSPVLISAAVTIQKVIAFPTDHDMRLQITLSSDQPGSVELSGSIVEAGDNKTVLWQGPVATGAAAGASTTIEQTIPNLHPKLWTPGSPYLYNMLISARQGSATATFPPVRSGFRSIASKNGQILLNGKPIFLRGIAINPPGRDIPDDVGYSKKFATDYVRYLRSQNVNLIRMTFDFRAEERQQAWFDACDELGMMVDQGEYGAPPGQSKKGPSIDPEEQQDAFAGKDPNAARTSKSAPPEKFEQSLQMYKDVFETYARHPSIIIYVLANELPGPNGSRPEWHDFLAKIDAEINKWDPSRIVIGNAGYGLGGEGDINDVHRYWGWYYNSFLTYYNLRDTVSLFGASTAPQPFTFSECVGSFTSPFGNFNAIFRKQLAPQLGWTGHSGEQQKDALAYQSFMVKHALESFRTMREQNPRIAGLMPFTILFFNWEGIASFDQMRPKPAMEQMGISYSPILTSIELWTPQVYADTTIHPIIHIVNDADDFSDLQGAVLTLDLLDAAGNKLLSKSGGVPHLSYFGAQAFPIDLKLPAVSKAGDYTLVVSMSKDSRVLSRNQETIYIAPATAPAANQETVLVFDPAGTTLNALTRIQQKYQAVTDLARIPANAHALAIGEGALTKADPAPLKQFVANGGRVLCLAQEAENFNTSWLPAHIEMLKGSATDPTYTPKVRPTADQQNVNPERAEHPVFNNVPRERLRLWSDYTNWNQARPGFPKVYPVTHGFKIVDPGDLAKTAILADYDRGLEANAIAEFFDGKGSVILTGLDLVNRAGLDPVADQMLANLINYLFAPDHELHPLIDKPIAWGNYPTERGVLSGPMQGLVYNCRWVEPPTAPHATSMPDNTGAWNTHPGNPFIPHGVRPFGPYSWSTGASPREDSKDANGSGFFYCRVPAGRKTVASKVQNPGATPQAISVSVNNQPAQAVTIAAGQTSLVRTPIAAGATDLLVRYTGNKQLVIEETSFE